MNNSEINALIQALTAKEIIFTDGLSDDEVNAIHSQFGLILPDDLRAFLQTALPISQTFINWRAALNNPQQYLAYQLASPLEGILFDVQANHFWWHSWGEKPPSQAQQLETIRQQFAEYPVLIPVYSHRYIPSTPCSAGNPVFSVVQTDIIYYGENLYNYLINEFQLDLPLKACKPRHISFWSDLAEANS